MKKLFVLSVVTFLTFVQSCNKGDNPIAAIPGGEIKSTALILVPSSDRVNVYDVTLNRNIESLSTDSMPSAIAVSPDNRMILVTNYISGTVSVFLRRDNSTFTKLNSIGNGKNPTAVYFNPNKNIKEAYVCYEGEGKVLVMDTSNQNSSPKVVKTISLPDSSPEKIIVTNDGNNILISDSKNSRIINISRTGNNFNINYSDSFKTNNENMNMEGMIIVNNKLLIADNSNNQVLSYDITSNKLTDKISLKDNSVGDAIGPKNLVAYTDKTTNKQKIYVSDYDASAISVIDASNFKLIKNILLSQGNSPSYNPIGLSIATNSDKKDYLYVTNSSGRAISIIDPSTDILKMNISDVSSLALQKPLDQIITIGAVM